MARAGPGRRAGGQKARCGVLGDRRRGRHVDAGKGAERIEQRAPRGALGPEFLDGPEQGGQRLLAVAQDDGVQKRRERLGLERDRPAGDHDGVVRPAIGAPEGNAPQLQHGEHVGEGQLVLQREPHDGEVAEGPPGLQADEGQLPGAQLGFQVRPSGEHAFDADARLAPQDVVEDVEAQEAHPDLVGVGKSQRDGHAVRVGRAAVLPADVARRLLDRKQEIGVGMLHGLGAFPAEMSGKEPGAPGSKCPILTRGGKSVKTGRRRVSAASGGARP